MYIGHCYFINYVKSTLYFLILLLSSHTGDKEDLLLLALPTLSFYLEYDMLLLWNYVILDEDMSAFIFISPGLSILL